MKNFDCAPVAWGIRVWRKDGDTYLLAVNVQDKAYAAELTLSENFGEIHAEFGPAAERAGDHAPRLRPEPDLAPVAHVAHGQAAHADAHDLRVVRLRHAGETRAGSGCEREEIRGLDCVQRVREGGEDVVDVFEAD